MSGIGFSSRMKQVSDEKTGAEYYPVSDDKLRYSLPFRVSSHIKTGSSWDLYKIKSRKKVGRFAAAKVFNFQIKRTWKELKKECLEEVAIFQKLEHNNIVRCLGAVMSPSYGVIIMDHFKEGTLHDNINSLRDLDVHQFFVQIACAVRHLHKRNIVHRNINLQNILLKRNAVYLADFGLCQQLSEDSCSVNGRVGTDGFIAPEADAATSSTYYNGYKADAYSVGVFLWCMLFRTDPDSNSTMMNALTSKKKLDSNLLDSAYHLLRVDPEERLDVIFLLDHLMTKGYRSLQIELL